MKKLLILTSFAFCFASCNFTEQQTAENKIIVERKESVSADGSSKTLASIEIEGMTCQHGCARNIQSKLGRLNGVITCEVSFEEKKAKVEFDDTKITEKEMISEIQKIHNGQYTVTKVELEKFVAK